MIGPISQIPVILPYSEQSIVRMFQPCDASNLIPTASDVGLLTTQRKKTCGLAGPAYRAPSPIHT
jgi:hypothetical protein